jgi:outer membrane protein TolC
MRTPILLAVAALLLGGCYSPSSLAPDRAMGVWRDLQVQAAATIADAAAPGNPMEFTAEKAVAWALRVHPDIRVAQARVARARTLEGAFTLVPDAELRLTEFHLDQIDKQKTAFDLGLRVRPSRPGITASQRHRAAQDVHVAQARLDALRIRVTARTRSLHARAKLADVREAVLGTEQHLRIDNQLWIEGRVAHGAATDLDLRLAELSTLESSDEMNEARLEALEARAQLKALLQIPPGQDIMLNRPAGGTGNLAAPPDREAALEEALTNRPETREVAARLIQAQSDLWREEARRWPWLSFAQVSREIGPKAGSLDFGFALGVELPLERWFGDKVATRQAQVEVLRQAELAAVASVVREVDEALARLEKARTRYLDIQERLLPAIEAAHLAVSKAEALEGHEPVRRLKLELTRLSASRRALAAESELVEAWIHLRRVLARP